MSVILCDPKISNVVFATAIAKQTTSDKTPVQLDTFLLCFCFCLFWYGFFCFVFGGVFCFVFFAFFFFL